MKFLLFVILFACNQGFAQRYMVKGKDTLPYKDKMIITSDTTYKAGATYLKFDTTYECSCNSFEKLNGKLVNRTDSSCLKQGLWAAVMADGSYTTSVFTDNDDSGEKKYYGKNGKLLKETKEIDFIKHRYTIKETNYSKGIPSIVINQPLFGFYLTHFATILSVLIALMVIRIFINSNIYNQENGTGFSMLGNRFKYREKEPGEIRHELLCIFTVWFIRYKQQVRYLVLISNGIIAVLFLSLIIFISGLILCG